MTRFDIRYELNFQRNLRALKQNLSSLVLVGHGRFSFPSYRIEKDITQAIKDNDSAEKTVREHLLK